MSEKEDKAAIEDEVNKEVEPKEKKKKRVKSQIDSEAKVEFRG